MTQAVWILVILFDRRSPFLEKAFVTTILRVGLTRSSGYTVIRHTHSRHPA